ncbi:MAG: polyprenyl synthetase family protein [Dehalococcoidia bacterium]|jgi:geranylgeranyl pyrophosphate synthase|nr:polyprenyl synthetase family protein [Dehalococcoidia bacterium]
MGESRNSMFEPVEKEIALVEEGLKAVADVRYPWLVELLGYIVNSGGKRVRPTLSLLAGKLQNDSCCDALIYVATGVELLHNATLVHDDTIDLSSSRRGKPTAASIWGWGIATLAGDYLFSKAAELVSQANSVRADRLFAQTLMALCTGELEESFQSFDCNQSRETYFDRIGNKTASLFAMATESGAIVTGASEDSIQALSSYGYNLGMAFQIIDDIFDFTAGEDELGKPVASDLLQGHLTLPAIMLRERYPDNNLIDKIFEHRQVEENLEKAINLIRDSSIIPDCYNVAQGFIAKACQSLEMFPDSPYRHKLSELAGYVVNRRQ